MATEILFSNNLSTTVAAPFSDTDTSLVIAFGSGALWPFPSTTQVFYATLEDTGGHIEIVKVTGRIDDTLFCQRGQDNTTARAWVPGDTVTLRIPRVTLQSFPQVDKDNTYTAGNTFNNGIVVNNGSTLNGSTTVGSGGSVTMTGYALLNTPTLNTPIDTYYSIGTTSGAVTLNFNNGNIQTVTLTANTTFSFSNVPSTSNRSIGFMLIVTNGGTGLITWPSGTKWPGGTIPALTTSGRDRVIFFTENGGTTWDAVVQKDFK